MTDDLQPIKEKVNAAFAGFIANDDAVYSIKRSLVVALASAAGERFLVDARQAGN